MNKVGKILLIVTCLLGVNAQAQQLDKNKNYVVAPIAFYNFENLFDTIVDPDTTKILQEEFTLMEKTTGTRNDTMKNWIIWLRLLPSLALR